MDLGTRGLTHCIGRFHGSMARFSQSRGTSACSRRDRRTARSRGLRLARDVRSVDLRNVFRASPGPWRTLQAWWNCTPRALRPAPCRGDGHRAAARRMEERHLDRRAPEIRGPRQGSAGDRASFHDRYARPACSIRPAALATSSTSPWTDEKGRRRSPRRPWSTSAGRRPDPARRRERRPAPVPRVEVVARAAAIAELVLWIGHLQWHFRTKGGSPSGADPASVQEHHHQRRRAGRSTGTLCMGRGSPPVKNPAQTVGPPRGPSSADLCRPEWRRRS